MPPDRCPTRPLSPRFARTPEILEPHAMDHTRTDDLLGRGSERIRLVSLCRAMGETGFNRPKHPSSYSVTQATRKGLSAFARSRLSTYARGWDRHVDVHRNNSEVHQDDGQE